MFITRICAFLRLAEVAKVCQRYCSIPRSSLTVMSLRRWIDSKTGKRSDVAHHFIYDKQRPNITLTVGHLVKRVIFEYVRLWIIVIKLDADRPV